MPCVHAYAFAARSGVLEQLGPSGFFNQYFDEYGFQYRYELCD